MACRHDGHDSSSELCALLSQARSFVQQRTNNKTEGGDYFRTGSTSSHESSESRGEDPDFPGCAAAMEWSATIPMTHFSLEGTKDPGTAGSSSEEDPGDWDIHTDDGFDDYPVKKINMPRASEDAPASPARRSLRPLPAGTVTLVVRNIPARYSKEKLLEEWANDGSYDLLHLPFNSTTQRPCGFAFVNFVSHEEASVFQAQVLAARFQETP